MDRDYLDSVVSSEEIQTTIWDSGCQKAPGLDDDSFLLVKKFWDILKHDIQSFVFKFFESSSCPQGTSSPFSTLIPKVPISLNGIHYKIIAKI